MTGSSRSRPPPRLPIAMPASPSSSRQRRASSAAPGQPERHRTQPQQPVGGVGDVGRRARRCPARTTSVASCSSSGRRGEQERRQRHRVPVHPDLVHLRQPHVDVVHGPRARGSGARGPTPLTRGSSRTIAGRAPRRGRPARGRRAAAGGAAAWRGHGRRAPSPTSAPSAGTPRTTLTLIGTPWSARSSPATVCRGGGGRDHRLLTGRNVGATPMGAAAAGRANLASGAARRSHELVSDAPGVYDWVRAGEVNSEDGGDGRAGFDVGALRADRRGAEGVRQPGHRGLLQPRAARGAASTATPAPPASPATTTGRSSSRSDRRKRGGAGGRNSPGVLRLARADDVVGADGRAGGTAQQLLRRAGPHPRARPSSAGSRRASSSPTSTTPTSSSRTSRSCASAWARRTGAPPRSGCRSTRCGSPGTPGLANHIARHTLDDGFDPAFSHQLELDHGIMTVYYELDHRHEDPARADRAELCGAAAGAGPARRTSSARRWASHPVLSTGLQRVAVIGAGGLSHWIGNPRVGDIAEDFDRWFLERLERGELDQVLDIPDDETRARRQRRPRDAQLAGRGRCRRPGRGPARWPTSRSYPWITGMAVAQWETVPDREQTSATAGAQDSRREESLT